MVVKERLSSESLERESKKENAQFMRKIEKHEKSDGEKKVKKNI